MFTKYFYQFHLLSLQFSQPEFELDREYLVEGWDNKFVLDYYDSLVNIAVGNGNNRTLAEAEVMRTIGFEIELAKVRSWRLFCIEKLRI